MLTAKHWTPLWDYGKHQCQNHQHPKSQSILQEIRNITYNPIAQSQESTVLEKISKLEYLTFLNLPISENAWHPKACQGTTGWNQKGGSSAVSTPSALRFNCSPLPAALWRVLRACEANTCKMLWRLHSVKDRNSRWAMKRKNTINEGTQINFLVFWEGLLAQESQSLLTNPWLSSILCHKVAHTLRCSLKLSKLIPPQARHSSSGRVRRAHLRPWQEAWPAWHHHLRPFEGMNRTTHDII